MPPLVVTLVGLLLVAVLWRLDHQRRTRVSIAVDIAVLWLVLLSSRPLGAWLDVASTGVSRAAAYDDGSPLEASAYLLLMLAALGVVLRRGVSIGAAARENRWLILFFLYGGLSVLWSDLPLVAAKRWVKDAGNLLMVLVVLSEADAAAAARAVFVRAAMLLVPMSLLLIRFYPEIGRAYHPWSGEMMAIGTATHKNSLGLLTMTCGLFVLADMLQRYSQPALRHRWVGIAADAVLLLLTAWLLQLSHSATSLSCGAIGAGLLLVLRVQAVRRHLAALQIGVLIFAGALWFADASFDVYRYVVVELLGRDLTLTTRTDVWPMLLAKLDDPWFGAGFNSFWTGERLAMLYERLGIIQAHNGYLETALNGGIVGVALLGLLLLAALRRATRALHEGSDGQDALRFAVIVAALIGNLSEASFSKMDPLWFALLLMICRYPLSAAAVAVTQRPPDSPGRPSATSP